MAGPTESGSTRVRYSNKAVRLLLQALDEVLGQSGVNAVLNLAGLRHLINNYPPNDQAEVVTLAEVSALLRALEEMYGPRASRGLALRAGRTCFKYGLKEYGVEQSLADMGFRLQPFNQKLKMTLEACAAVINYHIGLRVDLTDENGYFTWHMACCPECWGRECAEPCCYLAVGLLQEAVYWASNGKNFEVEETACMAQGHPACTIVIAKRPLD